MHSVRAWKWLMANSIDWKVLRDKAIDVSKAAYAPYSKFPVGAAALVDDGRIVVGLQCGECLIWPRSLCRVRGGLRADLGRGRSAAALAVVDATGMALMPCGRCRQPLLEHGGPELLIDHPDSARRLTELLPEAFGPAIWIGCAWEKP